jgi:CspA family cold shock protein
MIDKGNAGSFVYYPANRFVTARLQRLDKVSVMAETTGTIKRKTDKGFGFIAAADGTEYFFHQSGCVGTRFDDLREGQRVSFTVGQGPKGPRAENVKPE